MLRQTMQSVLSQFEYGNYLMILYFTDIFRSVFERASSIHDGSDEFNTLITAKYILNRHATDFAVAKQPVN